MNTSSYLRQQIEQDREQREASQLLGESNPFCTRFTQPGAIPFLFHGESSELDVSQLIDRFRELQSTAQIVGPHGSGKSTLLESLIPAMLDAGMDIERITLRSADSSPEHIVAMVSDLDSDIHVVIDGFEQLNWWQRRSVRRVAQKNHLGLLVTTHKNCGLPTLLSTNVTPELLLQLVNHLYPESEIGRNELAAMLETHEGNAREVFFALYDLWQSKTAA